MREIKVPAAVEAVADDIDPDTEFFREGLRVLHEEVAVAPKYAGPYALKSVVEAFANCFEMIATCSRSVGISGYGVAVLKRIV